MFDIGVGELLVLGAWIGFAALIVAFVAALARSGRSAAHSMEARLRELEDLHARGVISTEELAAAKSRVLAG